MHPVDMIFFKTHATKNNITKTNFISLNKFTNFFFDIIIKLVSPITTNITLFNIIKRQIAKLFEMSEIDDLSLYLIISEIRKNTKK